MIYLDNSATSNKKPFKVKKAVLKSLNNSVNIGRSSNKKSFYISKKIYEAREEICDLIGGSEPENVIFTSNATHALNLAFKGATRGGNPHIITTLTEHNSVLRQIYTNNVSFSLVPCKNDYSVEIYKIPKYIRDTTKLIVVNCASNVTGNTVDIKSVYDILKSHKIPILFDLSQAVGNIPINLYEFEKCMVAFSGHKSLLGPQGTGVLYISPDMDIKTIIEGGTGSMSNELTQPEILPDRFESGTLNTPGIMGLLEGVKFVKKNKLADKKLELITLLYSELKNMNNIKIYHNGNFENKIPVLSFNVGEIYSEEVASELSYKYNITVRGGFHCAPFIHRVMKTQTQGAVRVSTGYKNNKREIYKLIDSIYKISKKYQNNRF